MNRIIKRVAVLGSGVMGSRIACHFAGVGVEVWLLDMVLPGTDQKAPKSQRNKLVNDALAAAVKSNPSPIYTSSVLDRITTGNFEDDMQQIANADWIVEVVVERLDIKKLIYGQIEQYRKPSTLVTTNTSGIPIHQLIEGRTEDFKAHFCGAHFFNPPRYLRLLEVIPSDFTSPSVVDFVMKYGANNLGKTTVLCKDTPAFIANRVGIFSLMNCFHLMDQMGLTIDEVDALTGPAIGRPKSATFRTADVVGIDTLVKVANGVADNCLQDEARAQFVSPSWLNTIMENKWLGDKTGQGFFKKTVSPTSGEKEIWLLNLHTMVYEPRKKVHFPTLDALKSIESITQKTQIAYAGKDKAGDFYRAFHHSLFAYVANRIPEISDELYRLDDAMKAGFGWEIGAFEAWDCLGVAQVGAAMKALEIPVAAWVDQMLALGFNRFYKVEGGKKWYYNAKLNNYQPIPGSDTFLVLKNYDAQRLWKNSACNLYHIGDDVLGLEWNTKMNTIGGEVLEGIQYGIGEAEKQYKGLVIGNDGANFSAGANVGLIFMYAAEQEYDELNMVINLFQQTMMRVRYSGVPVVIAPHGLSLGGGCEINLHADKVIAAAETYIGLVELGVGLIPGGGGTKEFALRASDELHEDEPELNTLKKRFFTIATAKVATSAYDAYDLGILRKGFDEVSINPNRRLHLAKNSVIQLFDKGYTIPIQRKDIKVLGRMGLGALLAGINSMVTGGYATAHDALIAKKLAYVMCGGDLSEPTKVSEQYLLDLEREAFLSLCGEKKTLERIQSVLKGGKPIRN